MIIKQLQNIELKRQVLQNDIICTDNVINLERT